MTTLILFFFVAVLGCHARVLFSPAANDLSDEHVARRQDSPPLLHTFDLKNDFAPRDVLLQTDSGLTVTCIDCSMEGTLELSGSFNPNPDVVSQFLIQVSLSASSVVSQVTAGLSTAENQASSVVSSVIPVITSNVAPAATSLASIINSEASVIKSKAPQVIKSIFGLKIRDEPQQPDLIPDLLQNLLESLNIQVTQKRAVKNKFRLEVATGDLAVKVAFPSAARIGFGVQGALLVGPTVVKLDFDPFELNLIVQPFFLHLTASIAPRINATLSFGTDLSFQQPFGIEIGSASDGDPIFVPRIEPILLNSIDPEFCLTAALGPSVGIQLRHVPSNSQASITAIVELPRISACFDKDENVNAQCSANSDIIFENALHINTTAEFGLVFDAGAEVFGRSLPIPGLSSLPSFIKDMILLDKCFDLDGMKAGIDGLTTLDIAASTTVSSVSLTSSASIVTALLDKSNVTRSTTFTKTEDQNILPAPSAGASLMQSVATTTMLMSTVIKTVTRTIQDSNPVSSSDC